MKICAFEFENKEFIGRIEGDNIAVLGPSLSNLGILDYANSTSSINSIKLNEAKLLAPIKFPPRVFGLALNYFDHAQETNRLPPEVQTWFMKQPTSVNNPYGEVQKPIASDCLDFESELVVIIGKKCRHIPKERALEVIYGYCVGCDFSVRDWQKATPTMNIGKGFDTTAPFGPWVTTIDEIESLDELGIRAFVNGVQKQNSTLGNMVFKVSQMIEHLSTAMTLLPGDVIFTGTPAGVGMARNPPEFLKDGDIVRCEIDKLGAIENKIINEVKKIIIE